MKSNILSIVALVMHGCIVACGQTGQPNKASTPPNTTSPSNSSSPFGTPPNSKPPYNLTLTSPQPFQVFQRNADNQSLVPITGTTNLPNSIIQVSVVGTLYGVKTDDKGTFKAVATVPAGGWYTIYFNNGTQIAPVGAGEVFVVAGQSNSANYGSPRQTPKSDRMVAMHETGWQRGADPQPLADGNMGSPWPILGDTLIDRLNMPVGFISVGVGGTHSAEWLPGGVLYPRLQKVLKRLGPKGFRAVLWHQGESDAQAGVTSSVYQTNLKAIIAASHTDAGWDCPWVIAGASYLPANTSANMKAIRNAQTTLVTKGFALEGPDTDLYTGSTYRQADGAHFNQRGLEVHAYLWFNSLMIHFFQ